MTDYVSDAQARSLILDVGRRLYHSGFVASNDGNITCKVGDNAIWATPTGVSKGFMTEEMLVKMDLEIYWKALTSLPARSKCTFVCLKKIHRYRAWFMPILLQLQHLHALV